MKTRLYKILSWIVSGIISLLIIRYFFGTLAALWIVFVMDNLPAAYKEFGVFSFLALVITIMSVVPMYLGKSAVKRRARVEAESHSKDIAVDGAEPRG